MESSTFPLYSSRQTSLKTPSTLASVRPTPTIITVALGMIQPSNCCPARYTTARPQALLKRMCQTYIHTPARIETPAGRHKLSSDVGLYHKARVRRLIKFLCESWGMQQLRGTSQQVAPSRHFFALNLLRADAEHMLDRMVDI